MFNLQTIEGDTLTFETQEEMTEYVISRMVEQGIVRASRDDNGELQFTLD